MNSIEAVWDQIHQSVLNNENITLFSFINILQHFLK